jgi:hypothetical protein
MSEFYIIVKKDPNGTLSIVDDTTGVIDIKSDVPNNLITTSSGTEVYFYVQVLKDDSNPPQISVETNKYKLILDKGYTLNTNSNHVKDGTSYNTMANDASMKGGQNQVIVQQEVNGGQHNKQNNHNKRSYSKKNRKSRSKSDTLRNYFNYSAIETM